MNGIIEERINSRFRGKKFRFLITGAAGFVGTNLAVRLLDLNQNVTAVDSFITGRRENIEYVKKHKNSELFNFIEGDLNDAYVCKEITENIDYVFHEAAIASVPWSLREPELFHSNNDTAFFNILNASRLCGVKRFIYASSSAVYGTNNDNPHKEGSVGEPISVYGAAKYTNEIYAQTFFHSFGVESIGFRYFNIYGPFQDPDSAYAAVIPLWIKNILKGEKLIINGDGTTTRDFCFVDDIVNLNLLAATYKGDRKYAVYNGGSGISISLNELKLKLTEIFEKFEKKVDFYHGPFRDGDVNHSSSDITASKTELGFLPEVLLKDGLKRTIDYYKKQDSLYNRK